MIDFGTPEERAAALKVAEACKALNDAIWHAGYIGMNVKVIDLAEDWDGHSNLQIYRMERRTMILPTSISDLTDEPSDGAIYAAVSKRDTPPEELEAIDAKIKASLTDDLVKP